MIIKKCSSADIDVLAELNKQLIEDEKSDNKMNLEELKARMSSFLQTGYSAYFFLEENDIVGYALVNNNTKPLYLRQFLIERRYRRKHLGKQAIEMLIEELAINEIDIEVLSWNDVGMEFWKNCGFSERSRYMRFTR